MMVRSRWHEAEECRSLAAAGMSGPDGSGSIATATASNGTPRTSGTSIKVRPLTVLSSSLNMGVSMHEPPEVQLSWGGSDESGLPGSPWQPLG